ncbi:hypothetical protein CSAL01_12804 [Colletotrichum salicis]|uniref:Uncharacterized protein n=1 Tax=Colletotrichum salicis TaxID=1209931 RepID=A0A135V6D4_9PEZI|nr:hypothetical protein CSAL01_12804 [Colletotrichum salicis]
MLITKIRWLWEKSTAQPQTRFVVIGQAAADARQYNSEWACTFDVEEGKTQSPLPACKKSKPATSVHNIHRTNWTPYPDPESKEPQSWLCPTITANNKPLVHLHRPRPCTSTTAFTIRCRNKGSTPVGPLLDRDRDPRDACCPAAQSTCYICARNWFLSRTTQAFFQQNRSQDPPSSSRERNICPESTLLQRPLLYVVIPGPEPDSSRLGWPPTGPRRCRLQKPMSDTSGIHPVRLAMAALRPLPQPSNKTLFYVIDWSLSTAHSFSNINVPAAIRAMKLTWSSEPTMLLPAVLIGGSVV